MIRQVVVANAILLIQYAVASLVPLLLIPHIVSVIGLTEYGHIAVLLSWGSYGAVVVQYAFHLTGPKQVAQLAKTQTASTVFVDILSAKFLLLLVVIPVLIIGIYFLSPLKSSSSLAWLLLLMPAVAAGFNSVWYLQSQNKFLPLCLLAITGSLITISIGFNFVDTSNSNALDFAVFVSFFSMIFTGIGTFFLSVISINKTSFVWNIQRVLRSLHDGKHLFISQFVSMLYTSSGPIVINQLIGAKDAGAYSVTERVVNALMSAALLTHTAAYPKLATAYVNDRAGYWRLMKLILLGYLAVTGLISIIVILMRGKIVYFLYHELSSKHYGLLFWGLAWLMIGIFGSALTGYLTVSNRSSEVWPLTLKILIASMTIGIPSVILFGVAGWMIALVLSQILVIYIGVTYWKREHGK